jgi:hypothetical protein
LQSVPTLNKSQNWCNLVINKSCWFNQLAGTNTLIIQFWTAHTAPVTGVNLISCHAVNCLDMGIN